MAILTIGESFQGDWYDLELKIIRYYQERTIVLMTNDTIIIKFYRYFVLRSDPPILWKFSTFNRNIIPETIILRLSG